MKYLDKDEKSDWKKLKYLDKEEVELFRQRRRRSNLDKEEEEVEVFETLCFNFCGISEKKLKYLNKEEVGVFRQRPKKQLTTYLKHFVLNFVSFLKRSWGI